jgi:hypothetical protein
MGGQPGAAPVIPSARSGTGGGARAQQAIDYFVSQGWTREQAAGIAANLATESSWRPDNVGDSGQAYGLGQWHPDRQADFKRVFGKDIRQSTFEEQLAFVDWELKNTESRAGQRLRAQTTATGAGGAVSQYYERPRDVEAEIARRSATAQQIYAQARVPAPAPVQVATVAAPAAPEIVTPTAPQPPAMRAEGTPAQVTGGPPVSGSVDVTITHRNPPPGVTVAATGTGAVAVAPPRTEQQQLTAA